MNNYCFVVLFFGTLLVAACSAADPEYAPTVQLSGGKVRGLVQVSEDDHKVYSYEGIRYGHAERFAKATAPSAWTDVYDATKWRDACPQPGMGQPPNVAPFTTQIMSEDCLFLSVWTPNVTDKANQSVMVFIHGGAFIGGTIFTTFYDGRYLTSMGNVVIVTINYRLGPFGFLYGGTADTPGNLAYHDQILALKWVHDNIAHFGGDPHKVTIFGESAGSASVGAMILSPLTRGLFHRAIMQSASPTSHFGKISKTASLVYTKELATNVNCSSAQPEDTIKCLRGKSMNDILNGYTSDLMHDHLFLPIYGDDVMPHAPEEILSSGKFNHNIDLMYGVVQNEGASFVVQLEPNLRTAENFTLQTTQDDIKLMMGLYKQKYGDEVAQFYLGKYKNATQDQLKTAISDAWGDFHIVCPTILFGEQMSKLAPKHHFYSYRLMQPTTLLGCTGWMGVCHAEDLVYLFMLGTIKTSSHLHQLSKDMIHSWTSFAKSGHPTQMGSIAWTEAVDRSVVKSSTKFMNLDTANYKMISNHFTETCETFWKPKILV